MNTDKNDYRQTLSNYFNSKENLNQNLNTIGYRVFDHVGRHWGLSTNGHFDQYFNQCMLSSCESTYKAELVKVIDEQQSIFLRLGQPSLLSPFYHQLYSEGIWNVVAYYRKTPSLIEGYYFCGSSPENAAKLVNSIDCLKYISNDISKIFDQKSKIQNYDSQLNLTFSTPLINFYALSEREKICLINYILGKSVKQISNSLLLSSRTVETYVIRSKLKLGLKNKEEIIEFLLKSFDNTQLLEILRFSTN